MTVGSNLPATSPPLPAIIWPEVTTEAPEPEKKKGLLNWLTNRSSKWISTSSSASSSTTAYVTSSTSANLIPSVQATAMSGNSSSHSYSSKAPVNMSVFPRTSVVVSHATTSIVADVRSVPTALPQSPSPPLPVAVLSNNSSRSITPMSERVSSPQRGNILPDTESSTRFHTPAKSTSHMARHQPHPYRSPNVGTELISVAFSRQDQQSYASSSNALESMSAPDEYPRGEQKSSNDVDSDDDISYDSSHQNESEDAESKQLKDMMSNRTSVDNTMIVDADFNGPSRIRFSTIGNREIEFEPQDHFQDTENISEYDEDETTSKTIIEDNNSTRSLHLEVNTSTAGDIIYELFNVEFSVQYLNI